jgi:hypothetical protein
MTESAENETQQPVTFYTPEGGEYTTSDPVEITRLKSGRSHFLSRREAEDPVAAAADADTTFHPGDHGIPEVLAHLEENPVDAERVLAEERAGKARKGILGEE